MIYKPYDFQWNESLRLDIPWCATYIVWCLGTGVFGIVRAGVYKPKSGGPEVECAIKMLKPADESPNQKVVLVRCVWTIADLLILAHSWPTLLNYPLVIPA